MTDPDLHDPDWEVDYTDSPVGMRAVRLGAAAGARKLGASLYELVPGGTVAPYHAHHANEELMFVLAGRPRLRTPDGVRELAPGAVVSFASGGDGAHRISNPTDEPVRILLVSTMIFPEIAEYPETGVTLTLTGPGQGRAFPGSSDEPFLELYEAAIAADRASDADAPGDPDR